MGGADQLHAALGDCSCGDRLGLGADLVDHDHLGHVVLNRLDHHEVLSLWCTHLHTACLTNRRMRNVAVASDLVGGINHHHALAELRGENARSLAEHGGLTNAWAPHDQNRAAGLNVVAQDLNRSED